jgi:hypothetical protein
VREFIDIITEARRPRGGNDEGRPTRTTTRDETGLPNFDFMPELEPRAVANTSQRGRDVEAIPGRKSRRRVRTANVAPEVGAEAGQHFASLSQHDMQDEISDDEAHRRSGIGDFEADTDVGYEPVIPNTENLPAVISREVAQTGGRINPEWHEVKQLPGYFQSAIRALGRSVFRQFTDTPIEDIQVLTTLGNINSEHEVTGMMDWIRRNGARDDAAAIDFSQIMPGYNADTSYWRTKDYSFLLVHDFAGYYIYGWAGGRGVHLAAPPPLRRLR